MSTAISFRRAQVGTITRTGAWQNPHRHHVLTLGTSRWQTATYVRAVTAARAISHQTIQQSSAPQGVQVRFAQDGGVGTEPLNAMIGLLHDPSVETSYADGHYKNIDFAFYAFPDSISVWENGVLARELPLSWSPTDLFEIRVVGTVVTYVRNGAAMYTSEKTPTFPLIVDTSLYSAGARLNDVEFIC